MGCISIVERERIVFLNPSDLEAEELLALGFSRDNRWSEVMGREFYEIGVTDSAPILVALRSALGDIPIMNSIRDGRNKVYLDALFSAGEIPVFEPRYITEVE